MYNGRVFVIDIKDFPKFERQGAVQVEIKEEGFASDAQRRAAFASGYKEKGKKKKEEVEKDGKTATGQKPTKVEIEPEDKKLIDDLSKKIIKEFIAEYEKINSLSRETLEPVIKSLIDKHKTNFKGVGQPLRIALVGSRFGPGLYDVILSLDKAEVIKRLSKI